MTDAVTILGDLRNLVNRLDEAGKEIYRLEEQLAPVEDEWEDIFNDLMTSLIDSYEDEGKRPPGDEKCKAKVLKQMRTETPIVFGKYRRLRAELKRKQALMRTIEREIFARQSDLSYLKVEAQAVS